MPELDNGYFYGNCEYCGNYTVVTKDVDPFNAEIHRDYAEVIICDPCFRERQREI